MRTTRPLSRKECIVRTPPPLRRDRFAVLIVASLYALRKQPSSAHDARQSGRAYCPAPSLFAAMLRSKPIEGLAAFAFVRRRGFGAPCACRGWLSRAPLARLSTQSVFAHSFATIGLSPDICISDAPRRRALCSMKAYANTTRRVVIAHDEEGPGYREAGAGRFGPPCGKGLAGRCQAEDVHG